MTSRTESAADHLPDLRLRDRELVETRETIVAFIRDTVESASADGAVVGLSGGLDSTVTAHLAVDALGPDGVYGLVMPSTVNTEANMSDAERVAAALDIPHDVIPIEGIVQSILEAYPDRVDDREALGNVRARTRAVLNYLAANVDDRVVLGTGNRSEALVGYFTKYGDGAVDCNPIGTLYKTQVRQLAREIGVPADIIEKPPTAGLWTGQTDEDELGVTYPVLDAVLAVHVIGDLPVDATAELLEIDPTIVERVATMHRRSAHKRSIPSTPDT